MIPVNSTAPTRPLFTWSPDLGAKMTRKPSVHQTKFGDGYEVRTALGINFKPKSWALVFTRALAEAQSIESFLNTLGGLDSFTWVDTMGETGTYVCRQWDLAQVEFGVYQVNATFEQIYEY